MTSQDATTRSGVAGVERLGFALAVFAALAFMTFSSPSINHDNAHYLDLGRRLIEGGMPFVDFIDTNPPLIIYLNTIPAWLAAVFGVSIITAFRFCVASLALASLLLARRLLRRNLAAPDLADLAFWCLLGYAVVYSGDPNLGQREHLFVLAYLPFLLARWSRSNGVELGRWLAGGIGLLAGTAACIKPNFLVFVGLLELARLVRFRDARSLLRPEIAAFLVPGVLYGLHFLLAPEAMREAIFGRWLPLIREHYEVYYEPELASFEARAVACLAAGAALVLLFVRSPKSARFDELTRSFAVFTLVALPVLYVSPLKFFKYHLIPAYFGAFTVLALVAAGTIVGLSGGERDEPDAPALRRGAGLPLLAVIAATLALGDLNQAYGWTAALVVAFVGLFALLRHNDPRVFRWLSARTLRLALPLLAGSLLVGHHIAYVREDPARTGIGRMIAEETEEGDPVLIVNTSIMPTAPYLMRLNRRQASRWTQMFPIAFANHYRRADAEGIFPYPDRDEVEGEEARFLDELGEDIQRQRPRLIFVKRGRARACPDGFDIVDYLGHLRFFDREMRDYSRGGVVDGYQVFTRR